MPSLFVVTAMLGGLMWVTNARAFNLIDHFMGLDLPSQGSIHLNDTRTFFSDKMVIQSGFAIVDNVEASHISSGTAQELSSERIKSSLKKRNTKLDHSSNLSTENHASAVKRGSHSTHKTLGSSKHGIHHPHKTIESGKHHNHNSHKSVGPSKHGDHGATKPTGSAQQHNSKTHKSINSGKHHDHGEHVSIPAGGNDQAKGHSGGDKLPAPGKQSTQQTIDHPKEACGESTKKELKRHVAETRQAYSATKEAYQHLAQRPHAQCGDAEAAKRHMRHLENEVASLEQTSQRIEHDCRWKRNLKSANDPTHGLPALAKELFVVAGIVGQLCKTAGVKDTITLTLVQKVEHSFEADGKLNKLFTKTMEMVDDEPDRTEWLLNTVPGTSIKKFEAFITTLSDGGKGRKFVGEPSDYQHYVAKITEKEAEKISRHPLVDQIVRNVAQVNTAHYEDNGDSGKDDEEPRKPSVHRRATVSWENLRIDSLPGTDDKSQRHLIGLSWDPTKRLREHTGTLFISDTVGKTPTDQYLFEESAGEGTHIYIFDTANFGMRWPENSNYRQFYWPPRAACPNHDPHLTPASVSDRDNIMDSVTRPFNFHGGKPSIWRGAQMKILAGGPIHGIARKANIISVKENCQGDRDTHRPDTTTWAWRTMVRDVWKNNRRKKAVFVYSGAYIYKRAFKSNHHYDYTSWGIDMPLQMDFWLPLLREAWMLDIVVVVGAGPKGMHTGIGVDPSMYKSRLARGSLSPQRYGRTNNRLITTSSTDTDGGISNFASNIGPALDDTARIVDETLTGSDDVFTLGVRLTLPEGARAEAPTRRVIASAYSAAQIGGLAAYFMGIQRWNAIYMPGQTAWEVKKLIVGLKRRAPRSPDGHGLAYNGVHDAQCPVLPLFGIPSDPNGGPPNVQQYIPPPPPFPHPHPPIRHLVDLPSSANLTIVGDLSGGQNSSLVRRSSEISKPTVLYKNGHWDPKYHHLAESFECTTQPKNHKIKCFGDGKGGGKKVGDGKAARFIYDDGNKAVNLLCNHVYANRVDNEDEMPVSNPRGKGISVRVELKKHHGAKHPDKKKCKEHFLELLDRSCIKADKNNWLWKWGGTVEHDNYEYKIYAEHDPPPRHQAPKPKPPPPPPPKPTHKPRPALDCPADQIDHEKKRECYSLDPKHKAKTHPRAQFPRDSGLKMMDLACIGGPPAPHRGNKGQEIKVYFSATNGKCMEAYAKNEQTRHEKLTWEEKDCKCGIRVAIDGCDIKSNDLKWGGEVWVHDWKYAVMAWDSVHCPPAEKELVYMPEGGWNASAPDSNSEGDGDRIGVGGGSNGTTQRQQQQQEQALSTVLPVEPSARGNGTTRLGKVFR